MFFTLRNVDLSPRGCEIHFISFIVIYRGACVNSRGIYCFGGKKKRWGELFPGLKLSCLSEFFYFISIFQRGQRMMERQIAKTSRKLLSKNGRESFVGKFIAMHTGRQSVAQECGAGLCRGFSFIYCI